MVPPEDPLDRDELHSIGYMTRVATARSSMPDFTLPEIATDLARFWWLASPVDEPVPELNRLRGSGLVSEQAGEVLGNASTDQRPPADERRDAVQMMDQAFW